MDLLSFHQCLVLGVAFLLYLYYTREWQFKPPRSEKIPNTVPGTQNEPVTSDRDIVDAIERNGVDCIVFFGSQTGTAEDFASRLAQEAKARFGLKSMVADLDEHDFGNLGQVPRDKILIFVLATYGEGEPTDNAADFYNLISSGELSDSTTPDPLRGIQFCAFGLGNKTYEQYNWMVKSVSKALADLGAHCIGEVGEGDDGAGTLEEDFLAWKESVWPIIATQFCLKEQEALAIQSSKYTVSAREDPTGTLTCVPSGESESGLMGPNGLFKGPYTAQRTFLAPLSASEELFANSDRNCLHMEIDLKDSNLSYTTGDHIAIWPNNPQDEVENLLSILKFSEKRHQVIDVKAVDQTAKLPFPTPTTIDTIFRYCLEICGPVSRRSCGILAEFAPSTMAKDKMLELAQNKELFHAEVKLAHHNLASLLSKISNGQTWEQIPLSIVIENLTKLQPRFYSISSSSLCQPRTASITVAVESKRVGAQKDATFKGLVSNYLLALKSAQHLETLLRRPAYDLNSPRQNCQDIRMFIHLRQSSFRLPTDTCVPIIMIGPGTGVAPFRGFVQERAKQAEQGKRIGQTMLFFGCRRPTEDFIYKEELDVSYSH